ncbi:MAG: hypothetical protein IIY36_08420 [Lachnospiraceae bacterium]|nr:hypothetical protein [Lachnospiraceae bacterium]
MKFTAQTKVNDILQQFPWLSDELPKVDSRFEIINNPLARAFLRSATLQTVADKAGMDSAEIIRMLEQLIKDHGDPGAKPKK